MLSYWRRFVAVVVAMVENSPVVKLGMEQRRRRRRELKGEEWKEARKKN